MRLNERFIEYNANPALNARGDCAIRALSFAYKMTYERVKRELQDIAKNINSAPDKIDTIVAFADKHGCKRKARLTAPITVENFVKVYSKGTFVCLVKGTPSDPNERHLVAISDGDWYDATDCGEANVEIFIETNPTKAADAEVVKEYASVIQQAAETLIPECVEAVKANISPETITVNTNDISGTGFCLEYCYGQNSEEKYCRNYRFVLPADEDDWQEYLLDRVQTTTYDYVASLNRKLNK